jgi:hypothetical protein
LWSQDVELIERLSRPDLIPSLDCFRGDHEQPIDAPLPHTHLETLPFVRGSVCRRHVADA